MLAMGGLRRSGAMSPALSFHDAAVSTAGAVHREPDQEGTKRVTRRSKRLQAMVRVPMLDWPKDLFSDNVGIAELLAEDLALQWHLVGAEQDTGTYFQAAA
jgi:hypothetical protein